jgi:ubiquinone/menaquinone biosynthesis C-methylase UbiE
MGDGMERFDPTQNRGQLAYEHFHRYAICRDHVRGKSVLDLACGTGYGANILAEVASSVVGVDISKDAIAAAREVHRRKNLTFEFADCFCLPFESGRFDVIIANEMIEHVADHVALLTEAKRVLKDDGALLVSTPNKPVYNRYIAPNEFHVSEVTLEEFFQELTNVFKYVQMVGTRMALISIGTDIGPRRPRNRKTSVYVGGYAENGQPIVDCGNINLRDPEYLLAYCTDKKSGMAGFGGSIYLNSEDDLWLEHEKVISWASKLHMDYQELYDLLKERNEEYWQAKQKLIDLENELFKFKGMVHELKHEIEIGSKPIG